MRLISEWTHRDFLGGTRKLTAHAEAGWAFIPSAYAAISNDLARAVVIRVNSPGGSAVASDTIWREVCRVREAGKPVIVSMGEVAASGGYYIACPANVIVALPATLTGSIGVVSGKLVANNLLDRALPQWELKRQG